MELAVEEDFGITEEDEAAMRAIEEEEDEERREKEAVRKAIAEVEKLEREEEEAKRPPAVEETREAREERQRREQREEYKNQKPFWIPSGIEEVLEEQPKWALLAAVLEEIEEELHWAPEDLSQFFRLKFFSSQLRLTSY